MLDINITIVNYKMKEDIDRCLLGLYPEIRASGLNVQVHIVDNSENVDLIKEMLATKYPEAVYIDAGGNLGFGKSQNIGLGFKEAKYYLPLNPDIEFISGNQVLLKLDNFLENNTKAGIAGPKLVYPDGTLQYSCFRFPTLLDQFYKRAGIEDYSPYFKRKIDNYLMRDFDHNSTVRTDWLMGSMLMIRSDVVRQIGLFDERYFMYFEDCDLCRRSWNNGYEVWYVHDCSVVHGHRRDSDTGSQIISLFTNPVSRMHLKSWFKYHMKYRFKNQHFGI